MRPRHRLLAVLSLLIVPTGCAEEGALCADGEVMDTTTGDCVPIDFDAGPTDGGEDPDDGGADAGGCTEECVAPTPVCVAGECVECETVADCTGGEAYCDGNRCVDCRSHADCTEADAARCDPASGACVPCMEHADCEGVTGYPSCNPSTNECVECTPDGELTACTNGHACDPDALTCTGAEFESLGYCRECVSDNECAPDDTTGAPYRCVATSFGVAMDPVGQFCLLDFDAYEMMGGGAACPSGSLITAINATSVGGVTSDYCFPRTEVTSCSAITDLEDDESCTVDEDCGDPRYSDGSCVAATFCSYTCSASRDCIGSRTCSAASQCI